MAGPNELTSETAHLLDPERLAGIVEAALPLEGEAAAAARLALGGLRYQAELAAISPVTGLPNLVALHARTRFSQARPEVGREGDPVGWVTMYVDLDHFKLINDVLGHDQGNRALVIAAAALGASVRQQQNDELYHLSGDEFVAFLPLMTEEARDVVPNYVRTRFGNNLRRIAEGDVGILPENFGLTPMDVECARAIGATFGVYFSEGPNIDRIAMHSRAEAAMRESKRGSTSR
jgi:diguanylate cyclase (GGDEF)-like protein